MARIIWSGPAIWQLDEYAEYIARGSEFQAKRIIDRIEKAVLRLQNFPEIGAVVPEFSIQSVREIRVFRFRILYCLEKGNTIVRIVGVVHGAQLLTDNMVDL